MADPKNSSLKCCHYHHRSKSILDWNALVYHDDQMEKDGESLERWVK
ncbi:MAG TPA: hypothetical protein VGD14_20820 [bacterium]